MFFSEFTNYLEKIEQTAKRNDITVIVAELIKKLDESEAKDAMYLMQGRLVPKYVPIEFSFSRKLIIKGLQKLSDSLELKLDIEEEYKKFGDIGLLTQSIAEKFSKVDKKIFQKKITELLQNSNSSPSLIAEDENNLEKIYIEASSKKELSISNIHELLKKLALTSGKGAVDLKINFFLILISVLDPVSTKYISRIICGELRLGVSDKTILDSISWATSGDKSLRKLLDDAFGANPDIGNIVERLINSEFKDIEHILAKISLEGGNPIASKLVERESGYEAVWERMPNCFVQPKLDGLRGQIHYSKNGFKVDKAIKSAVYSRNMENMTDQFPELTQAVSMLGVDSIILDSEIVGYDVKNQKYFTYQETMQRKRKYDVSSFAESFPVKAMCFDILYLNGKDLTKTPLEERIGILKDVLRRKDSNSFPLNMLETKQCLSDEELKEFFEEQIGKGLEGIIAKQPGTDYEPGSRNFKWIKLKANTQSHLVDTIDVTVIGYFIGTGNRAKFGIGALLTALYNPEDEKFYSVGKVGSGMTEEMLEQIQKDLKPIVIQDKQDNYVVDKSIKPDFWVKPEIVCEIVADEITRSPNHTAAIGIKANVPKDNSERGLSVRFPRIKIWKRDKDLPNTVQELVRMYELRKGAAKD